jgi:hypothetical protein
VLDASRRFDRKALGRITAPRNGEPFLQSVRLADSYFVPQPANRYSTGEPPCEAHAVLVLVAAEEGLLEFRVECKKVQNAESSSSQQANIVLDRSNGSGYLDASDTMFASDSAGCWPVHRVRRGRSVSPRTRSRSVANKYHRTVADEPKSQVILPELVPPHSTEINQEIETESELLDHGHAGHCPYFDWLKRWQRCQ